MNRILQESGRCNEFLGNPEAFLEKAVEIIRDNRHALAINGISYIKLDGGEYYLRETSDSTELLANLDRNAVKVEHSVYDYIVYDIGSVGKPFALALDRDPDVKMFFKIPGRFKIETPIGTDDPDRLGGYEETNLKGTKRTKNFYICSCFIFYIPIIYFA